MAYNYYHRNDYDPHRELLAFLVALIGAIFFIYLLTGCSTAKTAETFQKADSVASKSISVNDSVIYREVATERLIDHFVNNTYVVSPLGDTVSTKTYEKLILKTDTKQTDSIKVLQSRCDSLTSKLKESKTKETVVTQTTPLSLIEKLEIKLFPITAICLMACIMFIALYIKKK